VLLVDDAVEVVEAVLLVDDAVEVVLVEVSANSSSGGTTVVVSARRVLSFSCLSFVMAP